MDCYVKQINLVVVFVWMTCGLSTMGYVYM